MSFAGKVAVVTGAGSGIGRELAVQLAQAGCHLALCDLDAAGLADTSRLAAAASDVSMTATCVDVTDRSAVARFVETVIDNHGGVDLLINNAGIAGRELAVQHFEFSDYENVLNVNMWGVVNCTHYFLPHLLQRSGSHIVNLSSIFGLVAFPRTASYTMSKFAVRAYTEALRADLATHDITVTSVHPGMVATNLVKAAGSSNDTVTKFEESGMSPQLAVRKILKGVAKRKLRIRVVGHAYLIDWVQRLMPVRYPKLLFPLFRVGADD